MLTVKLEYTSKACGVISVRVAERLRHTLASRLSTAKEINMQERVIANKVTNMLMIQILTKTTHYQYKLLHTIYFTMGPWDGMDS